MKKEKPTITYNNTGGFHRLSVETKVKKKQAQMESSATKPTFHCTSNLFQECGLLTINQEFSAEC